MSRLQKKCFVASAVMHGSLVLLLVVSPAFVPPKKEPEKIQLLTFIPAKLIDEPLMSSGSGAPAAPAPKPAEVSPPPAPAPQLLPPEPVAVKPVQPEPEPTRPKRTEPEPAPVQPKKPEPAKPNQPDPSAKAKPKHEIKPTYTKARDNSAEVAKAKAQAAADAKAKEAQAQFRAGVAKLSEKLNQSLSGGTGVELPDIGGGEAYANWHWAVVKLFEEAWIPDESIDSDSTVKVSVTILRNGKVSSHKILQRSGNAALDASVTKAIKRVPEVPAFPEGAKDHDRTLKLNFNLKSKRFSG